MITDLCLQWIVIVSLLLTMWSHLLLKMFHFLKYPKKSKVQFHLNQLSDQN